MLDSFQCNIFPGKKSPKVGKLIGNFNIFLKFLEDKETDERELELFVKITSIK